MTTVVALGGNALLGPGDRGTAAEQLVRLRETVAELTPLLDEPLVLTHGNGPQVGHALLRQERAADEVPPLPLWLAVAQTQAEIGSLAVLALQEAGHRAACVLTHTVVAADDPAFHEPTKPIGPFYDSVASRRLRDERGWILVEERGRGWRRVVPSPAPLELQELEAIRALLAAGLIVVACGGGGIPVTRVAGGGLGGVDAVIDKDAASALLAMLLDARRLLVLTDVDAVYRGFGSTAAQPIPTLTAAEAAELAQAAPPGSMGPKLASAAMFAQSTGREALITTAPVLRAALAGRTGTRISLRLRANRSVPTDELPAHAREHLMNDSDLMDPDIHELAAPYALDALDEDERLLFERHLSACARCATEVTSFRQTAAAMAYAVETAPPPQLRTRLLDAARAERRPERSNVISFPRRLRFRVPALGAAAALAAVAALALGIWNLSLTGSLDEERSARAATEQALALVADSSAKRISLDGAEGSLVVARDGAAALVVCRLGAAPTGKTYEAWVIEDGDPRRAGEFDGGGHCGAHALTEPVPRGATVAVTVEPEGGVDVPSGEPVLASEPA